MSDIARTPREIQNFPQAVPSCLCLHQHLHLVPPPRVLVHLYVHLGAHESLVVASHLRRGVLTFTPHCLNVIARALLHHGRHRPHRARLVRAHLVEADGEYLAEHAPILDERADVHGRVSVYALLPLVVEHRGRDVGGYFGNVPERRVGAAAGSRSPSRPRRRLPGPAR